jgi:3-deoxy-D-manno-octulosonic-acid transferase
MGRSLSLAAYRALSRRIDPRHYSPTCPRPEGQLLWINAPEPSAQAAAQDLAQRLLHLRYDLSVVITPGTGEAQVSPILTSALPSDAPQAAREFVQHWRPDCMLWLFGDLRPNLLTETHASGCPMILADADAQGFAGRRDRWLPDVPRQLLCRFRFLLARNPEAKARITQLGIPSERIDLHTPLRPGGQILPCAETDLTALGACLAGRSVWLASHLQAAEIPAVLRAHRQALKLSHRLLLVLHPAPDVPVETMIAQIQAENFRHARWSTGEEPTEATQVLISEDPADLGLFYRIAPLSFMGSSLVAGHGGLNPFDAAVLGSAVLYGPNVGRYLPHYTRLAQAGAARIVNDAQTLGTAVTRLIAPDQAAAMAHAGWDVISESATVTDKVIELVQDLLDTPQDTPQGAPS